MKNIVITGSSRGIGLGLAKEFLKRGHRVMISGRNKQTLELAYNNLKAEYDVKSIDYCVCDVTDLKAIQGLLSKAEEHGEIDIWINNAGRGQATLPFMELSEDDTEEIVRLNIIGMMYGCRVALEKMKIQGHGAIYNLNGFGSDGRKMKNMGVYGMTKYATDYFTKSLALESDEHNVIVGALSPGMVITDMLVNPVREDTEINREAIKIFNILADQIEPVSVYLVDKMLKNKRNGVIIKWLNSRKIMFRFMKNIFWKRKVEGLPDFQS